MLVSNLWCQDSLKTNKRDDLIKYYDENGIQISQVDFYAKNVGHEFFDFKNDSLGIRFLAPRKVKGQLKGREDFFNNLEKLSGFPINRNKPTIIIYYPGPDPCNTSGTATPRTLRIWHKELERHTRKIADVEPIYICKTLDVIEQYPKDFGWILDQNQFIEKSFFKYHYPCSSFVIINNKGEFFASYGEFGKEYLWKVLRKMK